MEKKKCKTCYKDRRCCHCKKWLTCFFDEPLSGCFECSDEKCPDNKEDASV